MNAIFDFSNISDFVASALYERQVRNKNYSLGSFARDLEISKSVISGVISGKKGLRLITLNKVFKLKNLNSIEEEYLKCIWIVNYSKSKIMQDRAKVRIKALRTHKDHIHMDNKHFNMLQEWYFLPILELISHGQSINEIAQSLGIKPDAVKKTVQLLLEKNYLKKDGPEKYIKFQDHIKFESQISVDEIKNYHTNFLQLSSKKLTCVPQEKRKFLTSTFTISSEQVDEAKTELENFLSKFIQKYSNSANVDDVYSLGIQFYPLTGELSDDR
jgi:uncharacterized protein (TIGR02147 family)